MFEKHLLRATEMARNTSTVAEIARGTASGILEVQNAAQSLTRLAAEMRNVTAEFRC
jgi:methyl-accepting chemotaxis protein